MIFASQNWVDILIVLVLWLLFSIVYFNLTGGIGKSIFVFISIFYIALFIFNPVISYIAAFVGSMSITLWQRLNSKEKTKYQKAVAIFEGGGIRRGLSPPEIAAVLGKPFHQILTLVFIGLLEKGFVTIVDNNDIKMGVADSMQARPHSLNAEKRAEIRRQGAQELIQILFPYEEPYLELIEQEDGKGIKEINLSVTINPFLQSVTKRVGGFDLDQTREYYRNLVRKFAEDDYSIMLSSISNTQEITWKLLSYYLSEEVQWDSTEFPSWVINAYTTSGNDQANAAFMGWVNELEKAIQSGLSHEDFEINLHKITDEYSLAILKEITHATYHR